MNPVVLRKPADIAAYLQRLNQNWRGPVEVRPYRPKRSPDQNNRLWWLHGLTAQRLNSVLMDAFAEEQDAVLLLALRNPWTPERVHKEIYRKQFLNGESSTRRNKMETVDDQTAYESWMVEIGVEFPETERYE